MNCLESFIDEMLKESIPKEALLNELLEGLANEPLPTMEQAKTGFFRTTNLHGIRYDHAERTVTIVYRVVDGIYEPTKVSFAHFTVVLEGLLVCRRKHKW